jgi:hypothetical protein
MATFQELQHLSKNFGDLAAALFNGAITGARKDAVVELVRELYVQLGKNGAQASGISSQCPKGWKACDDGSCVPPEEDCPPQLPQ